MPKPLELLKLSVQEIGHIKRLSQADIATMIETMPQQLSKQLGGKTDARISLLEKLAKALGVPPFYLLMSAQERAQWDEIGKPKQSDLSAIERRLAALEAAAKPSEQASTDRPEPGHLLEELEKLGEELELEINGPPLKKRAHKLGNG